MVLNELRRRLGFEEKRAKALGMTVTQYRESKKKLKEEEGKERVELEKWKIKQKYKRKRKEILSGKKRDILGEVKRNLETLGGSGLFSEPQPTRKRKRRKKR